MNCMPLAGSFRLRYLILLVACAINVSGAALAQSAGDPVRGATVFKRCAACHSVTTDIHSVGPSLAAVIGRPIASASGYRFSPGLASLKGNWTPENLDQFLASPQQFAKGTRMAFTGLKKPAERADLIAFLQSVAGGSK